jgi:hypothetical protein
VPGVVESRVLIGDGQPMYDFYVPRVFESYSGEIGKAIREPAAKVCDRLPECMSERVQVAPKNVFEIGDHGKATALRVGEVSFPRRK